MEMEAQQQENEEEITDDYRPTTNGSDTTATSNVNSLENEDTNDTKNVNFDGTTSSSTGATSTPSVSLTFPHATGSTTLEPQRKFFQIDFLNFTF